MRQFQQPGQLCVIRARQAEFVDRKQPAILWQQSDHGRLAVLRRHDCNPNVNIGPGNAQPGRPVLRKTALRDVEAGEDLDARDHGLR